MKIERYGYWPREKELERELLDELVISDAKLIHIERLSENKVFLGMYGDRAEKEAIQIYFEVADNGVLDWWFIADTEDPEKERLRKDQ